MAYACIYTCLFGDYERLNEQPTAQQSNIPYICFTDKKELTSDSWQIRVVTPQLLMDPIRSQRIVKIKPWDFLPEFDFSIYIDNSVILKKTPEEIFARYDVQEEIGLSLHSHRDKLLDEFLEVSRLGFDDQSRIFEQLNHYLLAHKDTLNEQPYWGGCLIRNHTAKSTRLMAEIWLTHVLRYSRRDQLSLNVAIKSSRVKLKLLDIDNFSSWFHNWPISNDRIRDRGPSNTALTLTMPVSTERLREKETEAQLNKLIEENKELLNKQKNYKSTKFLIFLFLILIMSLSYYLIKYY